MKQSTTDDYPDLVRFFEKQSDWLGLPRNTGPVLASLYVAKYESNERLSVDDICEFTNYSRSNVGLIISQLEALGLVYGAADYKQTGRGRRRILYSIDEEASSLISIGVKKMVDQLKEIVVNIDSLIELYSDDAPFIVKMLKELKKSAQDSHARLTL